MYDQRARVLWNHRISRGYYRIGLQCDQEFALAKPGQFVMVGIPDRTGPLLRRPFSIHRLIQREGRTAGIEILFKHVGAATKLLSELENDDILDLLGPLGSGFLIPADVRRIFLASGGIGVAPLVFLADYLHARKTELTNCKVYLGGRSKDDILCEDDFRALSLATHVTTDDGSCGDQCLVTQPLELEIEQSRPELICACGPMEMLACVVDIARRYHIPCQVSIETMMACGIGACLGCAVENREDPQSYLHVCQDGPVFNADLMEI